MGEEGKRHHFLIKDFNNFVYNQILHRGKGKLFAVIVYKSSAQKKYWNTILKTALKLMTNKRLWFLKNVNTLNLNIVKNN